jgi:succinate dehydrogenase / fumarate reductase flavoprotein subunit
MLLDLTHLGADKINHKLPLIRELCMKFLGLDPIIEPIPIRPVAHYSMGGIETDINGKLLDYDNVWAAGEVACVSLHGANRLGSNSTAECLLWGGICGEEIVKYLKGTPAIANLPEDKVSAEQARIFDDLMKRDGGENPYDIRHELRDAVSKHLGVYRDGPSMQEGLDKVKALQERFKKITVKDKNQTYNTNLMNAMEIDNLLVLAEVCLKGALVREESRGGHARTDFTKRDDGKWLKHTLATYSDAGPVLSYKEVDISKWKPVERKY